LAGEAGANPHFLGTGLTKELGASPNAYGALETFSYDASPLTLQALKDLGVIHIHLLPEDRST